MIEFSAIIQKFDKQGEKTGWTYTLIPAEIALQLKPNNKKSFRVKGFINKAKISNVALLPMGGGDFILALNAMLRRKIKKPTGAKVTLQLTCDIQPQRISNDLLKCLKDEPQGLKFFNSLTPSHKLYYSKWIESARTPATKAKRIAQAMEALGRKANFGEMMRAEKENRIQLKSIL